jgi:hypothetical protein
MRRPRGSATSSSGSPRTVHVTNPQDALGVVEREVHHVRTYPQTRAGWVIAAPSEISLAGPGEPLDRSVHALRLPSTGWLAAHDGLRTTTRSTSSSSAARALRACAVRDLARHRSTIHELPTARIRQRKALMLRCRVRIDRSAEERFPHRIVLRLRFGHGQLPCGGHGPQASTPALALFVETAHGTLRNRLNSVEGAWPGRAIPLHALLLQLNRLSSRELSRVFKSRSDVVREPPSGRGLTSTGPLKFPGAPRKIRTCDLRLRRPTLYPAELVAHARRIAQGAP